MSRLKIWDENRKSDLHDDLNETKKDRPVIARLKIKNQAIANGIIKKIRNNNER